MPQNNPSRISRLSRLSLLAVVAVLLALPGFGGANLIARANSPQPAATQDAQAPAPPAPCKGITGQPDLLKTTLLEVPRYQGTYVLVVAGGAKEKVTSGTSPALVNLPVEINDEPEAVAVTEDLHLTNVQRVPAGQSPIQLLQDIASGKSEAVILWAPLAGAGITDLGLDDKVSIFSLDRPKSAPAQFKGPEGSKASPCAAAVADELDSFGVLPAEALVPVYLRSMLNTPTPVFSMANAERGEQVFQQVCARCHGPYAVADPTLAPVNLLISIRRFQFVGFKYIVMNGRPQRGMPPLRGNVSQNQIALIYQYLVARSRHKMTAGAK